MSPQSLVYFIQSIVGGPIKIGRSVDVAKRLGQFQAGSPLLLKRFAADALGNEWFALSPELLDLVVSLGGAPSTKALDGEVKRVRRERRPPKVKAPAGPSLGTYALRSIATSQAALAQQLGVTQQAVSKWIRGEAAPDRDRATALEKLFGIPVLSWSVPAPDKPAAVPPVAQLAA